jgi:asparagine N-glycosylation enzyme membrane subunit Stt3
MNAHKLERIAKGIWFGLIAGAAFCFFMAFWLGK